MLRVVSVLKGYAVDASDGRIGTVADFLFDDQTWKLRWLVADVGTWWTGQKVLIHPSAIAGIDHELRELDLSLTKERIKGSPDAREDVPVSRQIENKLNSYYGWDPLWAGSSYFGAGAMASPLLSPPLLGQPSADASVGLDEGDPHLRSVTTVIGCHIHARDGNIGHLENFMVDDATWTIDYLIVDTKNWWLGKHVLLSPHAVKDISYLDHEIRLKVSRDQVKTSPPWDPVTEIEQAYQRRLHDHYDWPTYDW